MDEVIEQTSLGLTTAGQHQQLSNLPARPSSQSHGDAKLRAALLSSWIRRSAESNLHHTSADLLGPGLSPRQAPIKTRCFLLACTAQGVLLARPRLAASPRPRPGPRKIGRIVIVRQAAIHGRPNRPAPTVHVREVLNRGRRTTGRAPGPYRSVFCGCSVRCVGRAPTIFFSAINNHMIRARRPVTERRLLAIVR